MPKVKIIFVDCDADDYYSREIIRTGLEWEEVTDVELKILQNTHHKWGWNNQFNLQAKLIIQCPLPISKIIESAKLIAAKQIQIDKENAAKKEAKRQKKLQRNLAEKQRQLAVLKAELGED